MAYFDWHPTFALNRRMLMCIAEIINNWFARFSCGRVLFLDINKTKQTSLLMGYLTSWMSLANLLSTEYSVGLIHRINWSFTAGGFNKSVIPSWKKSFT